jgi:hypothetical protein
MNNISRALFIYSLCALVACVPNGSTSIQQTLIVPSVAPIIITVTPTNKPAREFISTPNPTPISTDYAERATAFPEKYLLVFTTQQITDNGLALFVEEINPSCHSRKSSDFNIEARLFFQNLTNMPLTLETLFYISPTARFDQVNGDIIPIFFTDIGKRVYRMGDGGWGEMGLDPGPPAIIQPHDYLETELTLELPYKIGIPNEYITIPPGKYFVKFIYVNIYEIVQGVENIWTGVISSNAIEVCITE